MKRGPNLLVAVTTVILLSGLAKLGRGADENAARRPQEAGAFRLNELLASNRTGRVDDQGRTSDWVEIHNASAQAQQLTGYRLTDDLQVLDKWPFPQVRVAAGGYQLVWMSGGEGGEQEGPARRTTNVMLPFDVVLVGSDTRWKYFSAKSRPDDAASQERQTLAQ